MKVLALLARRARDVPLPRGASEWLSEGERRRFDAFGSPTRREQFLSGRWLLRELLSERFGGPPDEQRVDVDAEGRSHLPHGFANVSHTSDWIACAVADAPVGIDIETLRPRRDLLAIAERVASPAEYAQLARLAGASQLEAFYRLWTLREAWLKSRGRGLDLQQMRALSFRTDERGDLACAHLPQAGLMLSVDVQGLGVAALPHGLNDEALHWMRWHAEPCA